MSAYTRVTNDNGQSFTVRVVYHGDAAHNGRRHAGHDPLVEFYDYRHRGAPFGPHGQYVASYYWSSLKGCWGSFSLHNGVPSWTVDQAAMADVRTFLLRTIMVYDWILKGVRR